jgi:large subunit ribosomal protein L6
MSRIGRKPVEIPSGVKLEAKDGLITVEGPKGKLTQDYKPNVTFKLDGSQVIVDRVDETKVSRSYHGLYRNLVQNMVLGVTTGFSKELQINGVGYRAEVKGQSLLLNLGYSTQFEYIIPEGINIAVEANTKVTVSGIRKDQVGQVAAEIRSIRPPEPYKGKGVKYADEQIRRKVGKSGVKK